jgi:hypothetical protein
MLEILAKKCGNTVRNLFIVALEPYK